MDGEIKTGHHCQFFDRLLDVLLDCRSARSGNTNLSNPIHIFLLGQVFSSCEIQEQMENSEAGSVIPPMPPSASVYT